MLCSSRSLSTFDTLLVLSAIISSSVSSTPFPSSSADEIVVSAISRGKNGLICSWPGISFTSGRSRFASSGCKCFLSSSESGKSVFLLASFVFINKILKYSITIKAKPCPIFKECLPGHRANMWNLFPAWSMKTKQLLRGRESITPGLPFQNDLIILPGYLYLQLCHRLYVMHAEHCCFCGNRVINKHRCSEPPVLT